MSGGLDILSLKEDDITKMLVATTHLGSENVNFQMEQYVFKRRADGVNIINLGKTWEKLVLAARAIVAIENASDVSVCKFCKDIEFRHLGRCEVYMMKLFSHLSGMKFNDSNSKADYAKHFLMFLWTSVALFGKRSLILLSPCSS